MPLVFNGFELGAILIAVLIAKYVTHDGESNWFEGVQLLAVYASSGSRSSTPRPTQRVSRFNRWAPSSCCSPASP